MALGHVIHRRGKWGGVFICSHVMCNVLENT